MSKTLKILSRPQGNAEEYGRWAVNPYLGCSNSCEYCYLKSGPGAKTLGGNVATLKKGVVSDEHAYHLAMAEIIEHREEIIKDGGLFMTFTSDPHLRKTSLLFARIVKESVNVGVNVTLLTKETRVLLNYIMFLRERVSVITPDREGIEYDYSNLSHVAFGWTLTGHDELEPNAPTNAQRIEEMSFSQKYVCSDHINIWASIEPVIDFPSALAMVYQAVNAGCQHFKIGLLTNNTHLVRKDFEFGEHKFEAYKVNDCLHFIEDVMRLTDGKATVYWKQSVRDLLKTIYTPAAVDELLNYPHSVGKDWNMFKKED